MQPVVPQPVQVINQPVPVAIYFIHDKVVDVSGNFSGIHLMVSPTSEGTLCCRHTGRYWSTSLLQLFYGLKVCDLFCYVQKLSTSGHP